MTLEGIRAAHSNLFYRGDWFDGQAFMQTQGSPRRISPTFTAGEVSGPGPKRIHAVDLAALYVNDPTASVWRRFLWTDDIDSYGNRIYVAGVGVYGCDGFQIHRQIAPPIYWVNTL